MSRKKLRLLANLPIFLFMVVWVVIPSFSVPAKASTTAVCDTYQVNGGDQAFLMNLNTPLEFGGTVYNGNVYVSPKGTITFGQGDYTFWDYPQTPSISIGSWDYHAFPNTMTSGGWNPGWGIGKDLYVRYGSTATSICVDWKVLPWGQSSGNPVYIRMLAEVNPVNYTWTPTYQVSSNAPVGARYGVRYTVGGPVQPLSIQTITEPPAPSPTPSPTETSTPEPSPQPTETAQPTESPTPSETPLEPTPEPSQPSVEPTEPSVSPTPYPSDSSESQLQPQEPHATQTPIPEPQTSSPEPEAPTPSESPSPDPTETTIPLPQDNDSTEEKVDYVLEQLEEGEAVSFDLLQELGVDYEDLPPDTPVELENGVVLTAEVADALEIFENPSEILAAVFTDPGKALTALANVGADMTPEKREESQQVVVAAVIAGQLMNGLSVANNIGRKL